MRINQWGLAVDMAKIDFKSIADNLELVDDIWLARSKFGVSYPAEGHECCFHLEENSFWFRHRNDCIVELVKQFPPGGVLYDVGGGNGFVSKELQENGLDTVLLEPGEKGVSNARRRGVKNIICAALENAGFKLNTLTAVGLFDVLEHLKEDRRFLKLIFDLLVPRGRLYITVPTYNFLWSANDEYAGHFRRYTMKSMGKMLAEIGFRVEYATYIFSILPIPIFLFRSLAYKLGWIKQQTHEKKHERDHFHAGIPGKLLGKIWQKERKWIKNKKTIPLGSSCLIAAVQVPVQAGGKKDE